MKRNERIVWYCWYRMEVYPLVFPKVYDVQSERKYKEKGG